MAMALVLHGMFLLLPAAGEKQPAQARQRPIEIELGKTETQAPISVAQEAEPETNPPEPVSEPAPATPPPPAQNPPETFTASPPPRTPEPEATVETRFPAYERDFNMLSDMEKKLLTSTILARQYITEESAADRLFGKVLVQDSDDFQKDFHYPLRKDLVEMLNQPLPDLPFEYTSGLVYFAYDPGLKGDLQRFWDIVTPEFGWRTKYGTEVKCALILIIPGCVWK